MITGAWLALQDRVAAEFSKSGIERERIRFTHAVRMQYYGQLNDIEFISPHPALEEAAQVDDLIAAFEDAYAKMYASSARSPEFGYLVTHVIVHGTVDVEKPALPELPEEPGTPPLKASRPVHWGRASDGEFVRDRHLPARADQRRQLDRRARRSSSTRRRPSRSRRGARAQLDGTPHLPSHRRRRRSRRWRSSTPQRELERRARRASAGRAGACSRCSRSPSACSRETGHYGGLRELELMRSDPIGYEKLFSRLRGGLVSARSTALNISASPIVRELGELCFALYTPEGDSVALSTGIIVHVHTMSDAIKWMVRNGYEENPGIRPGDIFANNDPTIGDVHNADVQTFVPIFWEGELVAWAGGVTHVLDIGASTPGGVPVGPTTRYEDGIDLPCMKIGEHDELARWHLERCRKRTRASAYYLLDERTRLAGCHMIRDAVERLLLEEGVERFKRFSREVIEEGRRSFKSRIREMTVPGRYRSPAIFDAEFADKEQLPARARRDIVMHSPFEVRIGGDGTYELDYDGASAWGWHSMNCTPSGMQGAIWVMFTQTLICNDKVNDGAYFAIETNFPEGTIANLGDAEGSTAIAWAFLQPSFTGLPAHDLARAAGARLHRGGARRLLGLGQRPAGRRHRPVRRLLGDHELRDLRAGDGREVRARRDRLLRRDVQPRGRHGRRRDVGADLPVRLPLAAREGVLGRPRPPPRRLELRVAVHGQQDAVLGAAEHRHRPRALLRRACSAATRARPPTSTTSRAPT